MDFLSLFFYRLPQDYIPKKRKKKVPSCIFSQESWCSSTNHVCKYNCMYSILHSYIHSTSKTSIYSVSRRLTDFSVLDEAYFLPNSFYVDFPIEINVPHTQTIQLAVIYTMVLLRFFSSQLFCFQKYSFGRTCSLFIKRTKARFDIARNFDNCRDKKVYKNSRYIFAPWTYSCKILTESKTFCAFYFLSFFAKKISCHHKMWIA